MSVRVSVDLGLIPSTAFDEFVDELAGGLQRLGFEFNPGRAGNVMIGTTEVGRIVDWIPGKQFALKWQSKDWDPKIETKVEARFDPIESGTRVTIDYLEWSRVLDNSDNELAGWFAREIVTPLFLATSPARFGDWLTDRKARRPSGAQAREGYRDPVYHRPNFKAILKSLELTPRDYLLEVGCGGGALLEEALRSGCRATGVDHSPEMVKLAQEVNRRSIKDHRLEIRVAEADRLPYPNSIFTSAIMTGVFGFIADPIKVLKEVHRVLKRSGRLVIFTSSSKTRGSIAAPEPMASRIHFYEDRQLKQLALKAGFKRTRVERPDLYEYAREAGVLGAHREAFKGREGQLLIAHKT